MKMDLNDSNVEQSTVSKLLNPIGSIFSSNDKFRFKTEKFDLDLTYITDKIIVMSYPTDNILEYAIRNSIHDVKLFLDSRHGKKYKIFNLCKEKKMDKTQFEGRVEKMNFPHNHSPSLNKLFATIISMDRWIKEDPENIAVVQCLDGGDRSCVVVASYLIYNDTFHSSKESTNYFTNARTTTKKCITIPSQLRYVDYIEKVVVDGEKLIPKRYLLQKILFKTVPKCDSNSRCKPFVKIFSGEDYSTIYVQEPPKRKEYKSEENFMFFDVNVLIEGDIVIKCKRHC
eukprot:TRINITY_DN2435_c0_g1_i2.p1 TRINITY_DN2435_c0_g1~~TRINITY_DN2435_c0_g1_i2.p1  ORF type:complete len:285 (-),score=41.24 TRINITY_DN2435_c0_g1_i2:320-1174(-)